MLSGKKRTIAFKFLVPMVGVTALTVLIFALYSVNVMKSIRRGVYQQEASAITSYIDESISSNLSVCLTNAVSLSQNTALVDALVLQDRNAAFEILKKVSNSLSKVFSSNFKIHMHDADAKSFLRSWDFDNYGEDLSTERKSVMQVRETKGIVDAVELSRTGITVRGVAPMFQMDWYVGSLEVILPGSVIAEAASEDLRAHVLTAVQKGAIEASDVVNVGEYDLLVSDSVSSNFLDELKQAAAGDIEKESGYFVTDNYFIVKYPVKGFNSDTAGAFFVGKDYNIVNNEIAAAEKVAVVQIIISLSGFVVIIIVMVFLLRVIVTSKLKALTDATHELADGDGDLTKRINIKTADEFETAADNTNRFISKVQHTVQTSLDSVLENVSASEELSSTAATLAQNISVQTSKVEESSVLVNEVASNLDKTEELAVTTTEVLEKGRDSLLELVTSMNSVVDRIASDSDSQLDLAANMQELNMQAKEIQNVLGIISEIADQTNLLALNASIEAARAGEHGRGFAVVADEVRKLAERTQTSLADISHITNQIVGSIGSSSKAITEVSESMREASGRSQELVALADDTSRKLDETVAVSSEMVKMSTFIATKTKGMIDAMEDITNISLENTQAGASVEQVAGTLAEKSGTVSYELKKFKV